jgi:hypothetical protein
VAGASRGTTPETAAEDVTPRAAPQGHFVRAELTLEKTNSIEPFVIHTNVIFIPSNSHELIKQ